MDEKGLCFYCETKQAVKHKYEKPCCDSCDIEFWSSKPLKEGTPMEIKAKRHKILIEEFEDQ
ncbi:hypothetical protein D7X33_32935 [Butyricicoccus sp. 1XD8-22]|nr:hypothetical protein D7X33_32935 [Butyricicoccus sp. 1XD8-22]